jgi:hypothetical protein
LVLGCGGGDNERLEQDAQGQNCGAVTYAAFDPANHVSQDARVEAQAQINEAIAAVTADPTQAAAVFAQVEVVYRDTTELQAKVQGRADDHFPGDPAAAQVGVEIDAFITDGIARGKVATTALDVTVAKQLIDKSLTRFFYLSVFYELALGERAKYDEAFGYLGTGADNDPASLRSVAAIALKRDGDNGTTLEPDLFTGILAGSCALDKRLTADGVEQLVWTEDEAYAAEVRGIDERMKKVLAASVGHEFFEPVSALPPDEAVVKLYEGALYFYAIEMDMAALGGQAATDAAAIGAMLRAAVTAVEAGDASWQATFDSDFIRDAIAAAYGITIQG